MNELTKTQSIGTSSKLVDGLLKKVNKRETSAEIRDKSDGRCLIRCSEELFIYVFKPLWHD